VPNDKAACIPIANLTASQACIDMIKLFEGFSAKAYPNPGTKAEPITIGYGMTAVAIGRPVVLGDTITKEQAEADLLSLLNKKFTPSVKKMITCPCVTQGQFDAMVSFAYNVGLGNLKKSSVLSLTNIGDKTGASNSFLDWNKAAGKVLAGLTKRREAEKALYLS
jgi:lysozyme